MSHFSADVIYGWSLAALAEPARAGGLEAVHPRRLPFPDAAVVDVRPERVWREGLRPGKGVCLNDVLQNNCLLNPLVTGTNMQPPVFPLFQHLVK